MPLSIKLLDFILVTVSELEYLVEGNMQHFKNTCFLFWDSSSGAY